MSGRLSSAEQHNLRTVVAERLTVSLWKLTVNANGPQLHSLNKRWKVKNHGPSWMHFLGKAAFMKIKIGSHLFIHNRYSDSTSCHPCGLLEPALLPGEGLPHSNLSWCFPSFLRREVSQPSPLCRIRRKDLLWGQSLLRPLYLYADEMLL